MTILLHIIAFLIAVFILVLAHEFGHFIVAIKAGIKVERFSIGFGKPLLKWIGKTGIEYAISPILLGGYVKMNDESYNKKSVWRRMAVMVAGVMANVLLAIILFWLMFTIGITMPKAVIGKITHGSIAYDAGLKSNSEITNIDGRNIKDWQSAAMVIISRLGDRGYMLVNGRKLDLSNWQVAKFNPDPIKSLGIEPYSPDAAPVINKVLKNSPAALMGLKEKDRILSVDKHLVTSWNDFVKYVQEYPKQRINVVINRGGKEMQLTGATGSKFGRGWKKVGYLGILSMPAKWPKDMLLEQNYPFWQAIIPALGQVSQFLNFNFIVIMKIITGKISLHVLGGPITILSASAEALQQGVVVYVGFLGLLSIMLAFINILPIPGLDGGNFMFLLIEAVMRRPLSNTIQMVALRIGMLLLALIIFIAIGNDLLRLFI
jgi:regulator of sigma E protease